MVQILNDNDIVQMDMKFNNIDYNATFDDAYFTLNGNMKVSDEKVSNIIEDIVYPMYLPTNTHLSNQEKVATLNGERVILTFDGENPFMMVQETASVSEEFLTIPIYGEPYVVTGTVGALSDSSITWSNNGMDYYVTSKNLSQEQLVTIANSINCANIK